MYRDFKNKTTTNSLISYSIIVLIFVTIRILSSDFVGAFDFLGTVGSYILNAFVQIGILFTISVFVFKGLQKARFSQVFKFYGFRKMSWKGVLYSFLLGIIVYIINVFVVMVFSNILVLFGYNYQSGTSSGSYPFWLFLINIVTTAVLPAICEETAHRGMLLHGLSSFGTTKAIIFSSILFGLMHMNIEQFFYTTAIGFALGYLTTFCDTIYPAIIIHFTNNALSTFMSFSRANGLGFDGMFTWIDYNLQNNAVIAFVFIILLLALLIILAVMLVKALLKESILRKVNDMQEQIMEKVARQNFYKEVENLSKENSSLEEENPISNGEELNLEQIISEVAIKTDNSDEITDNMQREPTEYKPNTLTKVLLICCFVLMGLVTLATFFIGVLCR